MAKNGFISITYGFKVDPEVLTEEIINRIEQNDMTMEEIEALGVKPSHYEGLAWTEQ